MKSVEPNSNLPSSPVNQNNDSGRFKQVTSVSPLEWALYTSMSLAFVTWVGVGIWGANGGGYLAQGAFVGSGFVLMGLMTLVLLNCSVKEQNKRPIKWIPGIANPETDPKSS